MIVKVGLKYIEKWNESMEEQILEYENETVSKGEIVFYGPSNFTRWARKWGNTPLREAVLGKSGRPCCINRGFGSSSTEHHLYYYPRVVRPLSPKVLVYAPGLGNSISFGYTMDETWALAERVVTYARTDFPDMQIYLLGLPLFRDRIFKRESSIQSLEYNARIKNLASSIDNARFLDPSGYEPLIRDDIFAQDKIHFNKLGYDIYAEFFKEALFEELKNF